MFNKNIEREFEIITDKKCPICASDKTTFLVEKYDDRFGQPDLFEYYFCNKCDIVFLGDKIKRERMADLYGKYYVTGSSEGVGPGFIRKLMNTLKLHEIIFDKLGGNKILLEKVKNNSKVLEVGSGFSRRIKEIIFKKKLEWKGLEADRDSIDKINAAGLSAYHGTIDNLEINEKFDVVILSQALEHQYDINAFFLMCKTILNPGGLMLFTTPNFGSIYREKYKERWINWHTPYHTILLGRKGIEKLSEKHGYKIKEYYSFTPTSWYFLQKNFKLPKRGEKNNTFNFNFPLIPQFLLSLFLRAREIFLKNDNDCIYCELELKR